MLLHMLHKPEEIFLLGSFAPWEISVRIHSHYVYWSFVKNEHNVVFSIGKRDCLGKSLALIELFLFFASLMQNYQFKAVTENLDLEPHVQFTQSPKPFEVILSKFK